MGVYLNSKKSGAVYRNIARSRYFVDKTIMLKELIPIVEADTDLDAAEGSQGQDVKYICITRPCRFGKTVIRKDVGKETVRFG